MRDVVIRDLSELEKYLSQIVRESVSETQTTIAKNEREKQDRMATGTNKLRKRGEPVDEADEEDADPKDGKLAGSDVAKKPTEKEVKQASLKDIIKTLNVLRSGRSTKDEEVKKSLKSYVDQLTSGEQESLFTFLSGLAEIMVGGVEGAKATDPQLVGIKTKPVDAAPDEEKVVVKTATPTSKEPENVPIIVGEIANKKIEKIKLKILMEG